MATVDEARELVKEKLALALPRRWAHVQGVARRAAVVSPLFAEDGDLLITAALLHDVGYAPSLVDIGFQDQVTGYGPGLADKVARSTATSTIIEIANEIAAVVRESNPA